MRVMLDCRSLTPAAGGIARSTLALAQHLQPELRAGECLELLVTPHRPRGELVPADVGIVEVDSAMIDPVFDQLQLPGLIEERGVDVYHGACFSIPIASGGAARVATVHDVVFRRHPSLVEPNLRAHLDLFTQVACELADSVVTVSDFSRQEIAECYGRALETIDVIPNAADDRFGRLRRRDPQGAPYLLYVGAIEPKKNVPALLEAFAALLALHPELPHELILAGGAGGAPLDLPGALRAFPTLAGRVRPLGRVSDAALLALLREADLFVYPSEYEGFGLPPLEAMAAGVPTVVSNRASLPEVVGDGALVVDPHEPERFAAALASLLTQSAKREDLTRRGKRRATEFSWRASARRLADLYRRVHQARRASPSAMVPGRIQ